MTPFANTRFRSATGEKMAPNGCESSRNHVRCHKIGRLWREPATWPLWDSPQFKVRPGWPSRVTSRRPGMHCKYSIPSTVYIFSTVYTQYSIYPVQYILQYIPSTVYTQYSIYYSIYPVQYIPSTVYIQYSIYPVQYIPSTVYTQYSIIIQYTI